jgi:hypothetical protein
MMNQGEKNMTVINDRVSNPVKNFSESPPKPPAQIERNVMRSNKCATSAATRNAARLWQSRIPMALTIK